MPHRYKLLPLILLMALTLSGFAQDAPQGTSTEQPTADKVVLTFNLSKDQTFRFLSEGSLKLNVQGQKFEISFKSTDLLTVLNTSDSGEITLRSETESYEQSVNGEKMPDEKKDRAKTTAVIQPNGELVSWETTEADKTQAQFSRRLFNADRIVFSDEPVGIDDEWSYTFDEDSKLGGVEGKSTYKIIAKETVDGIETYKIAISYKETSGKNPITCEAVTWVEITTGMSVKGESNFTNIPLGPPGEEQLAEGKVEGKRISSDGSASDAAKSDEKTIAELTKDFEKIDGLFTLYRKKADGKETIYLELRQDQLDQLIMVETTISKGSANDIPAGMPLNDVFFKFKMMPNEKIFMVVPNISFRWDTGVPQAIASDRSFPEGYLNSYEVAAKDKENNLYLIDISGFFMGDGIDITPILNIYGTFQGSSYGIDRDKSYIGQIKNFPDNLVVETAFHFQKSSGGGLLAMLFGTSSVSTLADDSSLPMSIIYNVFMLNDDSYKPRNADPRIGYFTADYKKIDEREKDDPTVRQIFRWQLEKEDPAAELSKPKKPLVFWIDNAVPFEYRDAVREGALWWNKAFEAAGFKDAITVEQMPDDADWDHADMRYNTIRWITSPDSAYAVTLFRVNPINGHILNGNISIDGNMVRYTSLEYKKFVDPLTAIVKPDLKFKQTNGRVFFDNSTAWMNNAQMGYFMLDMLGAPAQERGKYVYDYIREVTAHEMGHLLGLRHNFAASSYRTSAQLSDPEVMKDGNVTASLMDYTPMNIWALNKTDIPYWSQSVGTYDIWAIKYGYSEFASAGDEQVGLKEIASQCNQPGLAYFGDEVANAEDPTITTFDLSREPLAYWARTLGVSEQLMQKLPTSVKNGESYNNYKNALVRILIMKLVAGLESSRYIGAVKLNNNLRGDPDEKPVISPISSARQKQALQLINKYILSEEAFTFTTDTLSKVGPAPYFNDGSQMDYPMKNVSIVIQSMVLKQLMAPETISRVSNHEAWTSGETEPFDLPYYFDTLTNSILSELQDKKNVPALRRNLQRTYVDLLIAYTMNEEPAFGLATHDAKMLTRLNLKKISAAIKLAKSGTFDSYTTAHFEDLADKIDKVLNANYIKL